MFTFKSYREKAIEIISENGVRITNNSQVLMRCNRTYQIIEQFPDPDINMQNGYMYVPSFIKASPEDNSKL